MKRAALAAVLLTSCAVAGLVSARVLAAPLEAAASVLQTTTTPTATTSTAPTTTAPTTTAPRTTTTRPRPKPPRRTTIRDGVRVAGVDVGGLEPRFAVEAVRAAFEKPLVLVVGRRQLRVPPQQLGASAYVMRAVARARRALPGTNVRLGVAVRRARLRAYVRALAKRYDRKPVDSRLSLRNLRPWLTPERPGRALAQRRAVRAISAALERHSRRAIRLTAKEIPAAVTRRSFGPIVVIRRGSNRLYLYDGMRYVRAFGVATGQAQYPTPLGRFEVVVKWRDPWWYPPSSPWARGAKPIPPGPGNPLGTRWMGLSVSGVGIHGTPNAASIGYSVSHGCIRMRIPDAEWLFERVEIGAPVFIVAA